MEGLGEVPTHLGPFVLRGYIRRSFLPNWQIFQLVLLERIEGSDDREVNLINHLVITLDFLRLGDDKPELLLY